MAFTIFLNSVFQSWQAKGEADALTDKLKFEQSISYSCLDLNSEVDVSFLPNVL